MNETNCVIAHIAPPQITTGGDFVYRLSQPDSALGSLPGVVTVSATNIYTQRLRLIENCSVLVIQLLGDPDLLPVIEKRRRAGLITVFEISDNFLDFQPSNPASRFYNDPENRSCILQLISICDAVQVTVPALAEKFREFNREIAVFENRMQSIGDPGKKEEAVFVFGWGGSVGHFEDIKEIAPAIVKWVSGRDDVVFSLMADQKFKSLFTELPENRFRYRNPGTLQEYYDFVQTLHAGIAPLRGDGFNACRSDVKFMEYASRGAVPVCADTSTYNRTLKEGETGLLFKTTDEMISSLEKLAGDRAYRAQLAQDAFEYIRNERMEQDGATERLAFYRKVSGGNITPGNISLEGIKALPSLKRTPGTRHYLHEMNRCEVALYNAMAATSNGAPLANIAAMYDDALSIEPDSFMSNFLYAALLMGTDNEKALELLDRALALFPDSCESRLRKALILNSEGQVEDTRDMLNSLREDFPGYALAGFFLAQLAVAEKKYDEAKDYLRATVESNRWHIPALTQLAAMDIEADENEEALEVFNRVLELAPAMKTAQRGRAVVLGKMGREEEAIEEWLNLLKEDPSDDMALVGLLKIAKSRYKGGNAEDAAKLLQDVSEIKKDHAELLFWLMRFHRKAGNESAANSASERLKIADKEERYKSYYDT